MERAERVGIYRLERAGGSMTLVRAKVAAEAGDSVEEDARINTGEVLVGKDPLGRQCRSVAIDKKHRTANDKRVTADI